MSTLWALPIVRYWLPLVKERETEHSATRMAGQTAGLHSTVIQNDSQIALGLDLFWKAQKEPTNMEYVKKAGVPKQILSSTPNYTTGKPERICFGTWAFLTSDKEALCCYRGERRRFIQSQGGFESRSEVLIPSAQP